MAHITEEMQEQSYGRNVVKRLVRYIKPYWYMMVLCLLFVLIITGIELYRPIIIGDAIDLYINGFKKPYAITNLSSDNSIQFEGMYITQDYNDNDNEALVFLKIVMYKDSYYLFSGLYKEELSLIMELEALPDNSIDSYIVLDNKDNITLDVNAENTRGYTLKGSRLESSKLKILRNNDYQGLKKLAFYYLVLLIGGFIFNFLQTWILQLTGQRIIYNLRQEIFGHIHKLSFSYFDKNPVGRIVTRVTNDVEAINEMYSSILVRLFKNVIKIIGLAVVMLLINIRLSLYSFILLPLIIGLTMLFKYLARKNYRIIRTKITAINTFLSENISGIKVIQIFSKEKAKNAEFEHKSKDLFRSSFREMMIFAIFRPLIYFLSIVATAIILKEGGSSVITSTLSIGTLYIFIQYIGSFFEPIQELAEQLGTLQSALASAEKVFTILDEEPLIKNAESTISLPDIRIEPAKIEFKNVWFAYNNEDWILKDISFIIHPGEKVAFVGATGAGKTSILSLIGRYYDIQKGEILINGINIKDLDTNELRRAIGQVQQDVFMFTGDIAGNIRLKNLEISDEDIKQAAGIVNAAKFIEKLPNQYLEPVTERGSTLSAGQRQLLSFARTLAFNPGILVMDEATANIDTETEELIQNALSILMEGRTTIMVAHRLSTIQHADMIMVMHKGRIREFGTHQELLRQSGLYKKLYELQLHA